MLEPITEYFNNNQSYDYSKHKALLPLLNLYVSDMGCKFIDEYKLLNMLRYFKLYDGYNIKEFKDFAKYYKSMHNELINFEKKRQLIYGNSDKLMCDKFIENPNFLTITYNRLKRSISNRQQYIILKDALISISVNDIEPYINILLKKYNSIEIKNLIYKIENGNRK